MFPTRAVTRTWGWSRAARASSSRAGGKRGKSKSRLASRENTTEKSRGTAAAKLAEPSRTHLAARCFRQSSRPERTLHECSLAVSTCVKRWSFAAHRLPRCFLRADCNLHRRRQTPLPRTFVTLKPIASTMLRMRSCVSGRACMRGKCGGKGQPARLFPPSRQAGRPGHGSCGVHCGEGELLQTAAPAPHGPGQPAASRTEGFLLISFSSAPHSKSPAAAASGRAGGRQRGSAPRLQGGAPAGFGARGGGAQSR